MRETGFEVPCPWVKDRTASLACHHESRTEAQGKLPQLCKARCDGLLGDQRTQSHPPVSPVCCRSAVRSQSCESLWSGAGEERGKRGKIKEGGWQLASRRWGKVPLAAAPPAPAEAGGSPKSTSRLQTSRALRHRACRAFPALLPNRSFPLCLPPLAFEFSRTPAVFSGSQAGGSPDADVQRDENPT